MKEEKIEISLSDLALPNYLFIRPHTYRHLQEVKHVFKVTIIRSIIFIFTLTFALPHL